MKTFYYNRIKKGLYLYILFGLLITLFIGVNRYILSLKEAKENQLIELQKLSVKREIIMRDLSSLRENLNEARQFISHAAATPEQAIFERLDYIRGLNKDLKIRLGPFKKDKGSLSIPITMELRTDSFDDINRIFQGLVFKEFPLFRFQDTILRKTSAESNVPLQKSGVKGDIILCIIKGEVYTLRHGG